MRYLLILSLTLLTACATSKPTTNTQAESKYAKQGVVDAKGFLSKAQGSNEEMRLIIRKLLEDKE